MPPSWTGREAAIEEREAQLKAAEDDSAAAKAAPATKAAPEPEPEPAPRPEPPPEPAPGLAIGQEQALRAAQQYLETMPFSRAGLIEQLTSPYGSEFTQAEAEYAVSQVGF